MREGAYGINYKPPDMVEALELVEETCDRKKKVA